jgi:hypothetical protein
MQIDRDLVERNDVDEVKSKGTVRRVLDPGKLTAAKLRVEVRRCT